MGGGVFTHFWDSLYLHAVAADGFVVLFIHLFKGFMSHLSHANTKVQGGLQALIPPLLLSSQQSSDLPSLRAQT